MKKNEMGERIRTARLQRGLSQRQLAGKEMSRNFISMVESGRCRPSPESLRLIAHRLGKSPTYFLAGGAGELEFGGVMALVERVRADVAAGSPARREEVIATLEEAYAHSEAMGDLALAMDARLLLLTYLNRIGEHEGVLAQAEEMMCSLYGLGDRLRLARVYQQIGLAAAHLYRLSQACRAYEQALSFVFGLKSAGDLQAACLLGLAMALLDQGEYGAALGRFKEVLTFTIETGQQEEARYGIASSLFAQGEVMAARSWLLQALESVGPARGATRLRLEGYLARIACTEDDWAVGYRQLSESLAYCLMAGFVREAVEMLEGLAQVQRAQGWLAVAEETYWAALARLDEFDSPLMRGRIYRQLGTVYQQQGTRKLARMAMRASYDLLRQVGAVADAAISWQLLMEIDGA